MAAAPAYDLTSGERLELRYLRQQESLRRQGLLPTLTTISGQPYECLRDSFTQGVVVPHTRFVAANQLPNRVESAQSVFTDTNYGQRPPRNLVYAYQQPIQSNHDSSSLHHPYLENTTAHADRSFQAVQMGYMPRLDESSTHHPLFSPFENVVPSMEGLRTSLPQQVPGHDRNIINLGHAVTSTPLRCYNCGLNNRMNWLCHECSLHEGGYQNMRQQSALPPNAARPIPCSPADETVMQHKEMLLPTPVEGVLRARTSSPGVEFSTCPPHVKNHAYIPPSIPKPDYRNYTSPHDTKIKMPLSQVQPPPLRHRDGKPIFHDLKPSFSRSNHHVSVTPVSKDRKQNMASQAEIRLPSLTFSTPQPSALLNPVTPATITREAAHTSSPLDFPSSSAVPASKSEEPRPPIRQDAKSPPIPVRSGTTATTRLRLADLLNAEVKVKAESPVPSKPPKAPKKKVKAENVGAALNASHREDLDKIWTADPRVPTVESRKAWARARGIAYGHVYRWFYRKHSKALNSGDVIGEGSYELPPDAPEPREVVFKQEASEKSIQCKKVLPRKSNVSKVRVKLEETVSTTFMDPPALSTRSKSLKSQKVQALETRTSATHPMPLAATNSSAAASSLSIDPISSCSKRKLDSTGSSAASAIVSCPPPKSNKKRKTCASKPVTTRERPQNDARKPASGRLTSKVTPKTNPPRSVKATRNIPSETVQKIPAAPCTTQSAASATKNAVLGLSSNQVTVYSSADSTTKNIEPNPAAKSSASSLFTDFLIAQPPQTFGSEINTEKELPRYRTADIKFVPISEHWEDLSYISLLQKWKTTTPVKCLSSILPTSDTEWRAPLSEQILRDERLLPLVDESWDMEGIEDMEFTAKQLKEIVELNDEMRVCYSELR